MSAAEARSDAGEGMSSLHRTVARCLVLTGGIIAAWLLASGVASASEESEDVPGLTSLAQPGGIPVVDGLDLAPAASAAQVVQAQAAAAAQVVEAPAAAAAEVVDGLAGAPLSTLAGTRPTDLAQAVTAVTDTVLSAPQTTSEVVKLPGSIGLPLRADLPAAPPQERRPVSGQRPIDVAPAVRSELSAAAESSSSAVVAAPAAATPASRSPRAAGSVGSPSGATPVAPEQPSHTPTGSGLPCKPTPASPAPAAQPTTMGAMDVVPADEPTGGWRHVRVPRNGSAPTNSIAEEPGATPD